jgi:hypothetical protein
MKASVIYLLLLSTILFAESVKGSNRYWVSATNSTWNNSSNWSATSGGTPGASVPGVNDAVIFNSLGLGNCTLDVAITITSINVNATYTGSIVHGAQPISITSTATFAGGSFSGGSGNITFGGSCTINGTAFTSTSGILEFNTNSTFSGGSFIHNNGRVRYNYTGASSQGIAGTAVYIFYNLEFVGTAHTINLPANNIRVIGSLSFTGSLFYALSSGNIDAEGDINLNNTATGCLGNALITINGTGVQNLNGSTGPAIGALPKLTINKSSGVLNLNNFISVSNHFTYTAGTVNEGSSTVCFTDGSQSPNNLTGSLTLNNIQFIATVNQAFKIAAATILIANGDLVMAGTANITLNTGDINVKGNITLSNTASLGGGSTIINIIGTGNQVMDGSSITAMQNRLPFININKSNGTLTLKGMISESQDWTYTSGTVDATTFSSTVFFGGNNLNIKSAGMNFYNAEISANTSTLTTNLVIIGNITISGTGVLSAGSNTISLAGNWIGRGTAGFTEAASTVNFNGSALQTITSSGGENFASVIINNSSSGVRLNNNCIVATTLNMTQGNLDLNGTSLSLGISVASNGTLARSSGIIYGSGSFTRWLKAVTIPDGSINGLFPLGTSSEYRPFFISAPSSAPGTGGTISVSHQDALTNTTTSITDGLFTVFLRKDMNWIVTAANSLSGGTYNLRVDGTGLGSVGNVSDLRMTLSGSVVGTSGINSGSLSNPQIIRTGVAFADVTNTFYVGTINASNSTLPQTFLSFSAMVKDEKVQLNWEISAPVNNGNFAVQRSEDGTYWQIIKKITASHTNESPSAYYSTSDDNIFDAHRYLYRIIKFNIDGSPTYSTVIAVTLTNKNQRIHLYPNPACSNITIDVDRNDSYQISLINSSGQIISNTSINNGTSKVLSVREFKCGLYYVIIKNKDMIATRKILITK